MEEYSNCIWSDKKRTFLGLPWSFTTYILTDKKFIVRKGFFNVTESECDLYKIMDKHLELPLSQRMIGCGTIVMSCYADTEKEITVKCIKHVRDVYQKIDEAVSAERTKYNTRGRDIMTPMGGMMPPNCDCMDFPGDPPADMLQ